MLDIPCRVSLIRLNLQSWFFSYRWGMLRRSGVCLFSFWSAYFEEEHMKRGILYAICFVLTISISQAVAHGEPDESSDSTQVKPENGKAEKEKKEDKKKGKPSMKW